MNIENPTFYIGLWINCKDHSSQRMEKLKKTCPKVDLHDNHRVSNHRVIHQFQQISVGPATLGQLPQCMHDDSSIQILPIWPARKKPATVDPLALAKSLSWWFLPNERSGAQHHHHHHYPSPARSHRCSKTLCRHWGKVIPSNLSTIYIINLVEHRSLRNIRRSFLTPEPI